VKAHAPHSCFKALRSKLSQIPGPNAVTASPGHGLVEAHDDQAGVLWTSVDGFAPVVWSVPQRCCDAARAAWAKSLPSPSPAAQLYDHLCLACHTVC